MTGSISQAYKHKRGERVTGSLATLASLLISFDCAAARDLDTGIQAYKQGELERAFPIIREHAADGNPTAKMALCHLYQQENAELQDEDRAFYWCRQAAVDGLDEAQFELGVMYLEGIGIEQDDDMALEWIYKASSQGHTQARRLLDHVLQGDFSIGC